MRRTFPRLLLTGFAVLPLACTDAEPTPGQETSPCFEGECFDGLVCLSDVCVAPDGGSTTGGSVESGPEPTGAPSTSGSSTTTTEPTTEPPTSADGSGSSETTDDAACSLPPHEPCDEGTSDPHRAMGLGCPGEWPVVATSQGDASSLGVRTGLGGTDQWAPTEGSAFAVISTGRVAELDEETPAGDSSQAPTFCSDDMARSPDPGGALPDPIDVMGTGGDCVEDPMLIGTGDCSNTISDQFSQGGSAFDYVELRSVIEVPEDARSISYDFAFFSVEYPFYFGDVFNDMFIVWLESELWTGNTAFDENGTPISLNASFLDFRDDDGSLPEFEGTCMRQHAGTRWLRSTAPVSPSEEITLVFATFDVSDPILDTVVFLDNVSWGCDGVERPSTSVPE